MKKNVIILSLLGFLLIGCNHSAESSETSEEPIEPNYYSVTWLNDDGTTLEVDENVLEGSVPSYDGETPVKENKAGYTYVFRGWDPILRVVTSDQTYTATYDAVQHYYKINFDLDGGSSPSYQPYRYVDKFDASLFYFDVTKENYYFRGWKYNDTQIFDEYGNQLEDNVEIVDNMTFKAIYTDMPVDDTFEPVIDLENNTVQYGYYPQSLVTDKAIIEGLSKGGDELIDKNGYYLYKHHYYKKVYGETYTVNDKFSNGDQILDGEVYWFKYEPITWKILSVNDGDYFLLSEYVLGTHQYSTTSIDRTINNTTISPNNYQYSEVRRWLNDEFYKDVFLFNDKYTVSTTVSNIAPTTDNKDNPYVCENTYDKVYLLSYQDCYNMDTKTETHEACEARMCQPTDYAKATGCHYTSNGSTYWTRSPKSSSATAAAVVYTEGSINMSENVTRTSDGIRPVIRIKIS